MQGKSNADIYFDTVQNSDGTITMTRTIEQTFSNNDYLDIYLDTKRQVQQIEDQIRQHEEQMQDILDEKNMEMAALHRIIEEESTNAEVKLEQDVIDADSLHQFQQVKELDQKIEQLQDQKADTERQLDTMHEVAEELADSEEDLELDE
jgi:hypothetical protein